MSEKNGKDAFISRLENINRHPRLWLSLYAIFFAIQISSWWYPKSDGRLYLSIARSYVSDAHPILPNDAQHPASPGYSWLISPAFLFGNRPFLALSVLHWLMAVICICGVYTWALRQFPNYAVLLTGIAMLNTSVCLHYRRTLKEIAFMTVAIWTVNLAHMLMTERRMLRTIVLILLTTSLLTLAAMVRYPGMVIAAGFGFAMMATAWHKRIEWSRAVVVTLAIGIPASCVVLYRIHHEQTIAKQHGHATYRDHFQQAIDDTLRLSNSKSESSELDTQMVAPQRQSIVKAPSKSPKIREAIDSHGPSEQPRQFQATNVTTTPPAVTSLGNENQFAKRLRLRIGSIGQITLPGMFKAYVPKNGWANFNVFIYCFWFVVVSVGWWSIVRTRRPDVLALSLPLYFLLYVIWPSDQGGRFLVPMAPILMAASWYGIRRVFKSPAVGLALCLFLHSGVSLCYWILVDAPRAYALHQEWPKIDRFADRIGQSKPEIPSTIIAGFDRAKRDKIQVMLELTNATMVYGIDNPVKLPTNANWAIIPTNLPVHAEFEQVSIAGEMQLIARKKQVSSSPTSPIASKTKPDSARR